jgi:hypothetical protein
VAYIDEPARAVLEWEGTGLAVSCTTSTLAARIAVERFQRRMTAGKKIRDKDIGRLAKVFVQHVAFWNIRRESGALVPLTAAGVLSLDKDDTLLPMLRQWMTIVANPPKPERGADDAAPDTVTAAEDPDEAILAAMEARTLTEPGAGEQLVAEVGAEEPAPVLEPV